MRFSDILKKSKESKEKDTSADAPQGQGPSDAAARYEPRFKPEAAQDYSVRGPRQDLSEGKEPPAPKTARDSQGKDQPPAIDPQALYGDFLSLGEKIFKENIDYNSLDIEVIAANLKRLIDCLNDDNQGLLSIAHHKSLSCQDARFTHPLNVCIYSIQIGKGFDYCRARLIELGFLALLHETPLVKYLFIFYQGGNMDMQEYQNLKQYSQISADILAKVSGLAEKIDSASPQGPAPHKDSYSTDLMLRFFQRCQKITNIADIYDSSVCAGKRHPFDVVQDLLNNKESFDQEIIRIFLDRIGIFPVGSLVKISTREGARVAKLNSGMPLRPVVMIISDSQGRPLDSERLLDLSAHPTIYIKGQGY